MAGHNDLAWPFFDDGHRAQAREFERWAAESLPALLEGGARTLAAAAADAGART